MYFNKLLQDPILLKMAVMSKYIRSVALPIPVVYMFIEASGHILCAVYIDLNKSSFLNYSKFFYISL